LAVEQVRNKESMSNCN